MTIRLEVHIIVKKVTTVDKITDLAALRWVSWNYGGHNRVRNGHRQTRRAVSLFIRRLFSVASEIPHQI